MTRKRPNPSAQSHGDVDSGVTGICRRGLIQSTLMGSLVIVFGDSVIAKKARARETPSVVVESETSSLASNADVETTSLDSDMIMETSSTDLTAEEEIVSTESEVDSVPGVEPAVVEREAVSPIDRRKEFEMTPEDVERLMREEEERRKQAKNGKGRIRELSEAQTELAQMQLELMEKEKELLDRDQSLAVLREELEIERKIRALLTKEKEQAMEEAALTRGLCAGVRVLP